jgi:hypothetical protein
MGLSLNVQIPESLQQALELAGYSAESLGVERVERLPPHSTPAAF